MYGLEGTGFDQYCRNGIVETVPTGGPCSGAITCWNWTTDGTLSWDQLEYVQVDEDCAGQPIQREVRQQAPEGRYRVIIPVLYNDKISYEVIKEFIISSNAE